MPEPEPISLTRFTLPVSRPDWSKLLLDWAALIPPGASPWLLSRFGELFVRQPNDKIGMLQVSAFKYEVVAKNETDFVEWLVDPDKLTEWFLAPLVEQLEAAGKQLKPDYCYSFITPLGLGGQLKPENVMIISIAEHFRCFGEIFRQIQGLSDGSHIVLKVS